MSFKALPSNEHEMVQSSSTSFSSGGNEVREEVHVKPDNARNPASNYTTSYRIFKTLLMVAAWLSFGVNLELTGTTLEDLKILLNVDYQSIAFALVIRSIGYIITTFSMGLVLERLRNYSETILTCGTFFMIMSNFLIPWIKVYWVSLVLFLLQGISQSIYDVNGNQIMLKLWNGVSDSPINAMHAGYGIGALISVQIVRPFIKFNPTETDEQLIDPLTINDRNFTTSDFNTTHHHIQPHEISLQIPFSISAIYGFFIAICFLIAQVFENRNTRRQRFRPNIYLRRREHSLPFKLKDKLMHKKESLINDDEYIEEEFKLVFIQRLLFNGKFYHAKALCYKFVQLVILVLICLCVSGYIAIICAFMLTYLTKGPAKIDINTFFMLQTLFWAFFVIGRFLAAFIAFKLNSLLFFSLLIVANIVTMVLFTIPHLNSMKSFYWFIICAIGSLASPLLPSTFMIAKSVLINVSAFMVSLFCVGFGIGLVVSQYVTGILLDDFKPRKGWFGYKNPNSVYVVPIYLIAWIVLTAILFGLLVVIHKHFNYLVEDDTKKQEENN